MDEFGNVVEREQTKQATDVTCPQCGAVIAFDPDSGMMSCEYCGFSREVPSAESNQTVEEMDFLTAEHTGSHEWGSSKKQVICKSCGAESIYDALQVSDVCPYCGATHVTQEAVADSLAPNGVAPFEIGEKEAGSLFKQWLKRGLFTPKAAKQTCKADAFTGIYLPYWTYDTQTTSTYTGRAGKEYRYKDKDGEVHTEIRWRLVRGVYSRFFDDHLVYASTRHEQNILDRILPFNYEKLVPYKPEYVAGFVSERYSIGLKDGWEIARSELQSRLRSEIHNEILEKYFADRAEVNNVSTMFDNITFKYVLFPVWMSSFKYKDKIYQFVVNGQTGKVGGKMPVSALRVAIAVLIGAAALAGLVWLFNTL